MTLVYNGNDRTYSINLNDVTVFTSDEENFNFEGIFHLTDSDALIVAESCSGSGCYPEYRVLWLPKTGGGKIIDLGYVKSGTHFKPKQSGDALNIDLGYVDKKATTAVVSNGRIEYVTSPNRNGRVKQELCDGLYNEALVACKKAREDCSGESYDILAHGGGRALASYLPYAKEDPYFNEKAFDEVCLTACRKQLIPRKSEFQKKVCQLSQ